MIVQLYYYDSEGTYQDIKPVRDVNEEKELNADGVLVFKTGITDVAPPKEYEKRAGISPRFDEATQTWEELTEALEAHKAENAQPVEPDTLSVEELTTMIMTASTIGEVQDQILVRRYGVSPEPVPTST